MIELWIVLGLLVLWLAVLLVRAVMFKPVPQQEPAPLTEAPDPDKAVEHLRQLIRCKTVSYTERELEDDGEFRKLYALLPQLYPHVYQTCELVQPSDRSLIYVWKGRSSDKPCVLMAHYDVVPVRREEWQRDAFTGEIVDGELWGRGTLDTKGTFNGVL